MAKLIGLRGKKGVGKNFVADQIEAYLVSKGKTVDKGAFAKALKDICTDVLGLEQIQCHGSDADKNTPTSYLWENMPERIRRRYPEKNGVMTGREVMQVFGTDVMRDFDRQIWIEATRRHWEKSKADYYLVTDVRFQNETESIRAWGGEVWGINGPQRGQDHTKNDAHPSETDLEKEVVVDRIIDNGEAVTKSDLWRQIDEIFDFSFRMDL